MSHTNQIPPRTVTLVGNDPSQDQLQEHPSSTSPVLCTHPPQTQLALSGRPPSSPLEKQCSAKEGQAGRPHPDSAVDLSSPSPGEEEAAGL